MTAGVLAEQTITELRLKPGLARRSQNAGGRWLYVIPGSPRTCIASSDEVIFGCWENRDIYAGRAITVSLCSGRMPTGVIEIAGIVPDHISHLLVQPAHGAAVPATVQGNTFLLGLSSAEPPPLWVYWTQHGRRSRHSTGVPPGTPGGGCNAQPPRSSASRPGL